MAVDGDSAELHSQADEQLPPRYCQGSWRQQVIMLGVTAAVVLGFALNLRFGREMGLLRVPAAMLGGSFGARRGPPGPAADPGTGANVQQVGTALRVDFNRAAQSIRPSTLAVKASYPAAGDGQPLERIGSAVVVDPSGYAVTCQHVVVGASRISVHRFQEAQRWLPARAIASEGDLALLKITDDSPFVPATFANSERLQVGDWVLAAGHPFQLGLSVTAGIVSRRNTTLNMAGGRQYPGLIQIDAAINEGSSGGPLVDLNGEVVGLNTAIYAPTGVFAGAGFAIPSNRVREFVARFFGTGAAEGAGWGLGLLDLSPELAVQLAYPGSAGVVINSVAPKSAAEAAAFARGDVITRIAGQPVRDLSSARQLREQLRGDPAVSIEVWRQGVTRVLTLRLSAG